MRKRMKDWLLIIISLGLFSTNAIGKDGSSGCGPGWFVLKDNSLVSSFLRGFTHGFSSPIVTLGMTFGTSNCAKHGIVDAGKKSEHLAMVTFERLRQDVARGDGLVVDAYAETFGCEGESTAQFKGVLQANYKTVFAPGASPQQIVDQTKTLVQATPELKKNCQAT